MGVVKHKELIPKHQDLKGEVVFGAVCLVPFFWSTPSLDLGLLLHLFTSPLLSQSNLGTSVAAGSQHLHLPHVFRSSPVFQLINFNLNPTDQLIEDPSFHIDFHQSFIKKSACHQLSYVLLTNIPTQNSTFSWQKRKNTTRHVSITPIDHPRVDQLWIWGRQDVVARVLSRDGWRGPVFTGGPSRKRFGVRLGQKLSSSHMLKPCWELPTSVGSL